MAQVKELNEQQVVVDSHITIVRPKDKIDFNFFGWAMIFVEDLIKNLGEGASGQTELSRSAVREIKISIPLSQIEQKKIVKKLDALVVEIEHVESLYQQKLTLLEELKKSLLQKAFSSELTKEPVLELA